MNSVRCGAKPAASQGKTPRAGSRLPATQRTTYAQYLHLLQRPSTRKSVCPEGAATWSRSPPGSAALSISKEGRRCDGAGTSVSSQSSDHRAQSLRTSPDPRRQNRSCTKKRPTTLPIAQNVKEVQMMVSRSHTLLAGSTIKRESVPLAQATTCFAPVNAARSASSCVTSGH